MSSILWRGRHREIKWFKKNGARNFVRKKQNQSVVQLSSLDNVMNTESLSDCLTELGLRRRNRRRQVAAAVTEVCTVLLSPVRVVDVACVRPCACVGGRVRVVVAPNHGYVTQ